MYQSRNTGCACCVYNMLRSVDVGRFELLPSPCHRDLGRDVDDRFDTGDGTQHGIGIANVPSYLFACNLGSTSLKGADLVATLKQSLRDRRAELARCTSDQNLHGLAAPPPANTSAAHRATRARSIFEL